MSEVGAQLADAPHLNVSRAAMIDRGCQSILRPGYQQLVPAFRILFDAT